MDETLILAIVGIATVGIMAIVQVIRNSGDIREAIRTGAEVGARNVISNPIVTARIEERLNHLPAPLREGISRIVDVYDPNHTENTLDNDTKQWIKNVLDNDASTGAIS
jgi:hypothetical protein